MFLSEEFSIILQKLTNLEEKLYEAISDDTKNKLIAEISIIKNEIYEVQSLLAKCGK